MCVYGLKQYGLIQYLICDSFVSRDNSLMGEVTFMRIKCSETLRNGRQRLEPVKPHPPP